MGQLSPHVPTKYGRAPRWRGSGYESKTASIWDTCLQGGKSSRRNDYCIALHMLTKIYLKGERTCWDYQWTTGWNLHPNHNPIGTETHPLGACSKEDSPLQHQRRPAAWWSTSFCRLYSLLILKSEMSCIITSECTGVYKLISDNNHNRHDEAETNFMNRTHIG